MESYTGLEIAVIGLAGRFPKAEGIDQFWDNLKNGRNCISDFTEAEALEEGEPEAIVRDPFYVKSNAYTEYKKYFDSEFFNYRPDEAELLDPQVRVFLECCWEALEDSGYGNTDAKDKIGVFAAGSPNINWELHAYVKNGAGLVDDFSALHLRQITFLSSTVSYRLNLKGPSVFVHTACSSSLVSIHEACNSLLLGECKMAIAGGVTIFNHSKRGYLFKEGMTQSRDGRCRTFDIASSGTVAGEGAGVVVLKRLKDALDDCDNIYAVIKGTGLNNDGSNKVGYTAPSVQGQADAIRRALKMAGTPPDSISYVEAHGTATQLGDPVEIEALNVAFDNNRVKHCAIGSVKSNIGHLDSAAGVAGFIKTVLAIKHKQIPASLGFNTPNPRIDFDNGPFYVNNTLRDWSNGNSPLRAGVSSFGVGGTNVHVVLEEPPAPEPTTAGRDYQLIVLSAKTKASLDRNTARIIQYLKSENSADLADIAFTLQNGRVRFNQRKILVCENKYEAVKILSADQAVESNSGDLQETLQNIIFMFSGQGSQYMGMCRDLYIREDVFRDSVDQCLKIAKAYSQENFYEILFPGSRNGDAATINNTKYAQPVLFIIEYSLARLVMKWGLKPNYMIGHSIGEYVAACISSVFSLEDALKLVIRRGELMSRAKEGRMISISASEKDLKALLDENEDIDLAVVNSPSSVVVSGEKSAIIRFSDQLSKQGYEFKTLHTSHAFHSRMMEELLAAFEREVSSVIIHEPQIPYISNLTGEVASYNEIKQPSYWSAHLRRTVQFQKGAEALLRKGSAILLELGPGRSLCNFVSGNKSFNKKHRLVNIVRQANQRTNDCKYLTEKLGHLWLYGVNINWDQYYASEKRRRVPLSTYAFEKIPYTTHVDARKLLVDYAFTSAHAPKVNTDVIHIPTWQRTVSPNQPDFSQPLTFLVISGAENFSRSLTETLVQRGHKVISARPGKSFNILKGDEFEVSLTEWESLFQYLKKANTVIHYVIYCVGLDEAAQPVSYDNMHDRFNDGYLGLSYLAKSIADLHQAEKVSLVVINNYLVNVTGGDKTDPLKAMILGPAKVMGSEILGVRCKVIDVPYPFMDDSKSNICLSQTINEIFYVTDEPVVAYRFNERWVQSFRPLAEDEKLCSEVQVVRGGEYIVTGGLGGMGLTIAESLVDRYQANVILIHRSDFPKKYTWERWVSEKGEGDFVSKKIRQIQRMEAAGAIVQLYQADISVETDVRDTIRQIKENHSEINGLVWAAGEVDFGGIIINRPGSGFVKYTSSKVHGLLLFEKYLGFKELDFVTLFSSIGNVFYQTKFGQVAYNAANEFLESYADYLKAAEGINALTINWCDWFDVGMTVKTRIRQLGTTDIRTINSKIEDAVYPKEGVEIFYRCLKSKAPALNVYKGDLNSAIVAHKVKVDEIKNSLVTTSSSPGNIGTESTMEEKLLGIVSDFFGSSIDLNDDFFELGADSLKIMTLVARINNKLGTKMSVGDIYNYPTVKQITGVCADQFGVRAVQGIPKAVPQGDYALSSAQKRMFFLQMLDKQSTAYNETQLLWVFGALDKQKFEDTFQRLIKQHEGLRTSFINKADAPRQLILDKVPFAIEDYRCGEGDAIDKVIQSFIRPFDLAHGPLIRVGIVQTIPNKYLLMIDIHHIVTDGVSQGILIKDFMALYNDNVLPELSRQYKDFAEWQQREEKPNYLAKQKDFWVNEFAEGKWTIQLPVDFPRPAIRRYDGSAVGFELSISETQKLRAMADAEGVSVFMVLLSICNILLRKVGGQEDVVIGTMTSGRQYADMENVIGMFVNILPLRNFPQGNLTFKEFLLRVKSRTLACFDNQAYQYEELVDELKIERNLSRNPLFDVVFSYQNIKNQELELPDLKFEIHKSSQVSSRFDILLSGFEMTDQIIFDMAYSTALFKRESIEKLIVYFRKIVSTILTDINVNISDIEIISSNERRQLLYDVNNTQVDYGDRETVLSLFKKEAKNIPERIALRYKDEAMSYRELNDRSDKVASYLRQEWAIEAGDLIGIMLNRDIDLIPFMFGILKSGGVFVPIDPTYPSERINAIVENAQLKLLISRRRLCKSPVTTKTQLLDLDMFLDKIYSCSCETDMPKIDTSDLAYVIYTSGSTGSPKGVMIGHDAFVNYVRWASEYYLKSTPGTFAFYTSISFDLTITSIFVPLTTGNEIILYEDDGSGLIEKVFLDNSADLIKLTPSHLKVIRDSALVSRPLSNRIKKLIVGGEELEMKLARDIYRKLEGQVEIFNEYGPTEATVGCMIYKFNPEDDLVSVPIGIPISNTQVYILDKDLKPVPAGIPGEMYLSGTCLAKGYLSNETLTNERFVSNPFLKGARMYKTGDAALRLADGRVVFKGRLDSQVKLRGFRIELGEIEYQLLRYESVQEVIISVCGQDDKKQLVAYYTAARIIEAEKLKDFLADKLPDFMVPLYFVYLKSLPLTRNGKLDKKLLPDPTIDAAETYVSPHTKEEAILVEVWSKVLGVSTVGVNDNFFLIGGDSIKSILICSRVRKIGYELSVKDIFANQTIKKLSAKMKPLASASNQSVVQGKAPLTPIQQWFFESPVVLKHHFNQSVILHFSEGISEEEVTTIFSKLILHHDALRMVFKTEDGKLVQLNKGDPFPVSVDVCDLRKEENPAERLLSVANEIQSGFDLVTGPLIKPGLFYTNEGASLLVVIHHLVIDGVSWRILFEDIETLYQQIKNRKPLLLPEKTEAFLTWSAHLEEYTKGAGSQKAINYWNDFGKREVVQIPRDFPNGTNFVSDAQRVSFRLSVEETSKLLTETHSAFNTQINDILLTALLLSMERLYGQRAIEFHLEGHGRGEGGRNFSRTVGWFTTIYPVQLKIQEGDLSDAIKQVKEILRKIPNNGIDYLAQKYLHRSALPDSKPDRQIQVSFNYLGQFDSDTTGKSFSISVEKTGNNIALNEARIYEWDIFGMISGGQLEMSLQYSARQYAKSTIETLMSLYKENLIQLVNYCSSRSHSELTPSDLTYKELSVAQVDELNRKYSLEDAYPLSPMQEGMLFHSLIDVNSENYLGQTTCRLTGDLSIIVVEESMNDLMVRHDILRTVFLHQDYDRPVQVVLKERKIEVSFFDIRNEILTGERNQIIQRFREKERIIPFDLSKDVLMRLTVLQTDHKEFELIWSHHHVLMDGWCAGILVQEFLFIYSNRIKGSEVYLPPVKPYSQYIEWLENREKEVSVDYWSRYLRSYHSLATLPKKETVDAKLPYHLCTHLFVLDEAETKSLYQVAKEYGVTVNTLFECAWGLLLAKYNNADDVVFGAVVSGRPAEIEGIERMIGLFINTVPVRISFNNADTFSGLLSDVQAQFQENGQHLYHPLSEIQALSELGSGLFDHIITFENLPIGQQIEDGEDLKTDVSRPFEINDSRYFVQTNYDFNITVSPGAEFEVRFDYNGNIYDKEVIAGVGAHLRNILHRVTDKTQLKIKDISIFSDFDRTSQRERLSNDLEKGFDLDPIQVRFQKSFKAHRLNCAIEYNGQCYTYADIDSRSGKVSRAIARMNLPEGSAIGILCEDRCWLICSMIGILKSRMVFVPFETTLPGSRLSSMFYQSACRCVIADQGIGETEGFTLADTTVWLSIDKIDQEDGELFDGACDYQLDDSIYVYFTSGSTGKPKGVVGSNKGLSQFIEWEINEFTIDPSFRISQFTNAGFDAFLRDVFIPICSGGTLCIPGEEVFSTGSAIVQWIDSQRISLIHCVPSFFRVIRKASLDSKLFSALKFVLLSGEKIAPHELKGWFKTFGSGIQLVNLYGATETTLVKGYYLIKPEDCARNFIPVKAMPGAQFLLLDKELNLSPRGAAGEIYTRTPYRTKGYLDFAEANKRAFIVNPFGTDPDDLIYKTGDMGREHVTGELEIVGRLDDQVKINGIRIELDDIRENMLMYPGVSEAIVVVRVDGEQANYICAYYTAEVALNAVEFRNFLSLALPRYMVPAYLVPLTKIPLLQNGKLDRKALPDPTIETAVDMIPPGNDTEAKLAGIWSDVLKVDRGLISTSASFFEMGGHSIRVFHLINKIQDEFAVKLKLGEIFKNASIRKIAALISSIQAEDEVRIPKVEKKEYYPASPAQERMYYQHLLHKESIAFNISIPIEVRGEIDVHKFNNSFKKLIDRHEALRTSFQLRDDGVIQIINPMNSFELEILDHDGDRTVKEEFNDFVRAFDLSVDPLIRCRLLRYGSKNFLFIDLHHIVADAASLEILIDDFKKIHLDEALTPLDLRYVDYTYWINTMKGKLEDQRQFWSKKLGGKLQRADLPVSKSREDVDTRLVSYKDLVISGDVYQHIKEFTAGSDVSNFMFLLSAYYILLLRMSGKEDIIIGTEVLGRTHPALKGIVGTFVNVLPLRIVVNPESTFLGFLNEVKENCLAAFENQDFQFEQMVSLAETYDEIGRNPIFDFYFSFANEMESQNELNTIQFVPLEIDRRVKGEYEFAIKSTDVNGKFNISFIFSTELFDEDTIKLLMAYYSNILHEVIKDVSMKIEDITLENLLEQV